MSPALQYLLHHRNLQQETIIDWQLGYCPDWRVFTPDVVNSGKVDIAEKVGLVRKNEREDAEVRVYDYFHHRITIPIYDAQGRLVGFGGRAMPNVDTSAKYMNSPTSAVYDKSKVLFGLHKARRNFSKHGMACLVEGYFDVIKLHQQGWDNAIATCGTALTEHQAKQIKRYTDTVLVMRDGDKAGRKAAEKDIGILLAAGLSVYVCCLPDGHDPDTFFDRIGSDVWMNCMSECRDGVEWLANHFMWGNDIGERAKGIEKIIDLLKLIPNQVLREQYLKSTAKAHKIEVRHLSRPIDRYFKDQEKKKAEATSVISVRVSDLPAWFNQTRYFEDGFVQNPQHTQSHMAGIYVMGDVRPVRITDFTIEPLYQIVEYSNPRRLIRVINPGKKEAIVELPNAALVTKTEFQKELYHKGSFNFLHTFSPKNFSQIVCWLNDRMPVAYELKTLGWQPESFFAFSNAVCHDTQLIEYDEMGMVKINSQHYLSLGNSNIFKGDRITDNPYENDLYLKYMQPKISFSQWCTLFLKCYDINAPYGIAFALLTVFKDLVTRVAKMPMLYCFGSKGSGKSAMAESITWLFFSGKNPEGDLIKGFNLNPGQSTTFSFWNRVSRFRNCPVLMNEFDENNIEPQKFGAFKAAYDGEGRERGDVDGKKKKGVEIQKVQGTIILVGQYLSTKDDGSVMSRSITCQFSLERIRNLSQDQIDGWKELHMHEKEGLSGLIVELLKHRDHVKKNLPTDYSTVQTRMMNDARQRGQRVEARLISNYSLMVSIIKTAIDAGLEIPIKYEDFYQVCLKKVIDQNRVLKDNNTLQQFWNNIESLFDAGLLKPSDIKIRQQFDIRIKKDGKVQRERFPRTKKILYLLWNNVYKVYEEDYRKRKGHSPQPQASFDAYFAEQPYYLGCCPAVDFDKKRTSGQAFDYDQLEEMGLVLESERKEDDSDKQLPLHPEEPQPPTDETPF